MSLLSEGISAAPSPLQKPTPTSPRVLVIGGGVVGLSTAWLLLDQGFKVTILADEWTGISSQAAGALWKCLPLECGPQAVMDNLDTNQRYTLESYKVYSAAAAIPELQKIVEMRPCTIVTTDTIDDNIVMSKKLEWIKESNIPGFRRGSELFKEYGINTEHAGGLVEAYEYMAPVINVDNALTFLMDLVQSKGALLKTGAVKGDLLDQEFQLLKDHQADAIINAMGLGAHEAAADPNVYGLHGALLRVINDGTDFPIVQNAMVVSSTRSGSSGGEGAFLLPRKDNILALGTISQSKGEAADLTVDSAEVKEMRSRCEDLLPWLKNARLDSNHPIIQGTRPQRRGGVRVERETRREGSLIVHSYGHGGAGWSLAFGTAKEAVGIVSDITSVVQTIVPNKVWQEETIAMEVSRKPSLVLQG
ncbi:hypothetical protein GP486_006595 [Trichoglossum hirsutum]|uniref:FAD dependent oxidoreductase domain-containing protein n=1 Tax=Trichoglossum hirsutum TaxID=265104 RepID=A0A9P8IIH0_9PEZI|nr:hypothetical protein GP486_006595 [Trichoglossum hirsutum]